MPALSTLSTYSHVGQAWSLWTPQGDDRGLNIASGTRKISSDIISVLLIRKGECPLHPEFGLAPDLFEPLSNYAPAYWVYNARQEILRWVAGIQSIKVDIMPIPDPENRLAAHIEFVPKSSPDSNLLTFGYYSYQGAIWNQELTTFLDGVQLNGKRFTGLIN